MSVTIRLSKHFAAACVLVLSVSAPALADRTITGTVTQDGGTFVVNPAGALLVQRSPGTALLTLTNGATTSGITEFYAGNSSRRGTIVVEDGSTLVVPSHSSIGYGFNSVGKVSVVGAGSEWTAEFVVIGDGEESDGTVEVLAGGLFTTDSNVIVGDAGIGTVTVSGIGSKWQQLDSAGYLRVGEYAGQGTVSVLDGGLVEVQDLSLGNYDTESSGQVDISGAGSLLKVEDGYGYLRIGTQGSGTLNILEGGQAIALRAYVGGAPGDEGGVGKVKVSGIGSKLTLNDSAEIGDDGQGEMTIENGGLVTSNWGYLAGESGSTGTIKVMGPGASWENQFSINVGVRGTGTIVVSDGGQISTNGLFLADRESALGFVTVEGTGSVIHTEYASVGYEGSATLDVLDGGKFISDDGTTIGSSAGTVGEINVIGNGSRFECGGTLWVGADGAATLEASNGGIVEAQSLLAASDDLLGDGTIRANGVVLGGYDLVFDAMHGLQQLLSYGTGGDLEIDIDGSGQLGVGYGDLGGSLVIKDGVEVHSTYGRVGDYRPGSSSTAAISGAGTRWINSDLLSVGPGEMTVSSGAQVSSAWGYVSQDGEVTIDGAGSKWTNAGEVIVEEGQFGGFLYVFGTLTVQNGGVVETQTLQGQVANLQGDGDIFANGAVLGGVDLVFDATHGLQQIIPFGSGGEIHLNFDGSGGLGAEEGGSVTIADGVQLVVNHVSVGGPEGSQGALIIRGAGSSLAVEGSMDIGGSGKLIVENGAVVTVEDTIYVNEGSVISGDGGTVVGTIYNSGTISPGSSPGTLQIDGDLTDMGTVVLEIASNSEFDVLDISGNLDAGGVIKLVLLDGFVPTVGTSFALASFGSFFDNGFTFDFSEADLGSDRLVWDASDFSTNGVVSVQFVPEPASFAMALFAVAIGVGGRRPRRIIR